MSAITAAKLLSHKEPARIVSMKMGNIKIVEGELLMLVSGYLEHSTPTSGSKFAGIAAETVDNSAGSDGDKSCGVYQTGLFSMAISGVAVTDIGRKAYAETNNPSDVKDDNDTPTQHANMIGRIVGLNGTEAWVDIGVGTVIMENKS